MKSYLLLGLAVTVGCAHTPPPAELTNARDAYQLVSAGLAAQPVELHEANTALQRAEKSFADSGASERTRDLSYIALRKAQLAEVRGRIHTNEQQLAQLEQTQREQEQVALQRLQLQTTSQQQALIASEAAREQAEQAAEAATAQLARVATVKRDQRGTVITLSGEVLFRSGKAELIPGAEQKLDQVARAVTQQASDARVVVEGYTDSRGSDALNLELSTRRAETVRAYLSAHGVAPERIAARGMGEAQPISNNRTSEGRANNRRVEIVVQPLGKTPS